MKTHHVSESLRLDVSLPRHFGEATKYRTRVSITNFADIRNLFLLSALERRRVSYNVAISMHKQVTGTGSVGWQVFRRQEQALVRSNTEGLTRLVYEQKVERSR